jgi:hypothetical protein
LVFKFKEEDDEFDMFQFGQKEENNIEIPLQEQRMLDL